MPIPRTFSNILNPGHAAPAFEYIWDPNLLTTGGNQILTGAFRAFSTTDISNTSISVSGLSLTVGSVAITGAPVVTNTGSVQGGNLIPIFVTGTIVNQITGNISTNVTSVAVTGGQITVIGGYVGITGAMSGVLTLGTGDSIRVSTGTALGNLDLARTYLPVSGINFSASVSVSSVAITGQNSGSALGNLDVTRTYLPTSGVGTFNVLPLGGFVGITGTVTTTASVTVGAVAITGTNSGSALGNLDVTRTYLPISGIQGVGIISIDTGIRATNVTNTAPIPISGVVQATLSATTVAVTGGTINVIDTTSWGLLSGISGALTANLSGAAWVTGQVTNVPGTVMAISGVVLTIVTGSVSSTISNPIGVSGVAVDRALPTVGGFATQFLPIGGRVMNPSGAGSITGYNSTGDMAMLTIAPNGGLYTNQGVLDQTQDNVTVWTSSTGAAPTYGVSGLAPAFFGVTLPNNPNRRGWFFQNIGTGIALVRMSATIPTSGNFDILVKGASTHFAGDGGSYTDSPAVYTGPVSVTGFGGAPIVWKAWDL